MSRVYAVDTEAEMADPSRGSVYQDTMLLITAMSDRGEEFIWDCRDEEIPDWFFELLEDETVTKVFHNASYDTKMLRHNYGVRTRNIWCSLMNERLLWLGNKIVDCGLEGTLKRRYGVQLDKSLRNNLAMGIVGSREREYALEDIRYLLPLQEDQEREIHQYGMENASRIENEMSYIVGQMEYRGLPFDQALYGQYMDQVSKLKSDAAKIVWDLLDYPYTVDFLTGEVSGGLNLGSHQKALMALHRKGILIKDYSEDELVRYLHKVTVSNPKKRRIVQAILEFKKWDKALTWNYDKLVDEASKCIHASYNSLGAGTSRTSSSKPNGQNIATEYYILKFDGSEIVSVPSGIDFRKLFVAPLGWKWIGADYSQIELRLYGGIAGVKSILDEYAKGEEADLHRQAATMVFHKPAEEISSYERTLGKPLNFGSRTFGGGANAIIGAALGYGLLLSYEEAESMRYQLIKGDPEGVAWGEMITAQARKDGFLYNDGGYRRLFPYPEQIRETVCRNTPVQGLASVIGKEGIINFWKWIEENPTDENVRLMAYVHDELNSIAKEKWAEDAKTAKVDSMVMAGEKYMQKYGIECRVDAYIGDH